jgi:hypothetical protein
VVLILLVCGLAGLFLGFGVISGVYLAQWVWKKLRQPTEREMYVWECCVCRYRVQSNHDLHINDRLICVQCNAEMEPYVPKQQSDATTVVLS